LAEAGAVEQGGADADDEQEQAGLTDFSVPSPVATVGPIRSDRRILGRADR
jgi:hypothetical protein